MEKELSNTMDINTKMWQFFAGGLVSSLVVGLFLTNMGISTAIDTLAIYLIVIFFIIAIVTNLPMLKMVFIPSMVGYVGFLIGITIYSSLSIIFPQIESLLSPVV